jgi:hypothetical protein
MRTRTFALLVLLGGAATIAQADPLPDFKAFASSDGRYKVLFPGAVKTETTDVKTASGGTLKLTLDSVHVDDDTLFVVSYVDAPDDVAKQPPGPRIDKVRDANKGRDGKILTEKEVALGDEKHPGRDVLIEKPATFLRVRIVIAGNRLYQVMLQGNKALVTSKAVDRYFDSFEVTK